MNSLLIDLSSQQLIAVICNGQVFEDISNERSSDSVLLRLDNLLKKVNLTIDSIGEIIINLGPGSFTGLRVALSLAKGLGFKKDVTYKTFNGFDYFDEENVILEGYSNFVYVKIKNKMFCEEMTKLDKNISYCVSSENLKNKLESEGFKFIKLCPKLGIEKVMQKAKVTKINGGLEPLYLRKSQAEIDKEKRKIDK